MVDDGTGLLEAPQLEATQLEGPQPEAGRLEGAPPQAVRMPDPRPDGTTRLVARMRHDRGQLARVAATVNNFAVRQLTYVSTDFGTATAEVVVQVRDAARVESKLRRMVHVIDVTRG